MPATCSEDPGINAAAGAILRMLPCIPPPAAGGDRETQQEREAIACLKLKLMIDIAVPAWVAALNERGLSTGELEKRVAAAGEIIAHSGDSMMFPGPIRSWSRRCLIDMKLNGEGITKHGDWQPSPPMTAAELFNTMAEGIAAGLILSGQSFEAWQRETGI